MNRRTIATISVLVTLFSSTRESAAQTASGASPKLRPHVEVEEDVYTYTPADNGAGPMWCHGSSCLVRVGERVFASGLETLGDFKPLNNCRWLLFCRDTDGWQRVQHDPKGRTREPCPLACFRDGRIFLSANPTLVSDPKAGGGGPARPEILQFAAADPKREPQTILPAWEGSPKFSEHSYRSFAADGQAGELILFQNIGYTHSEWAFRDRGGKWAARGKLVWPLYDDPKFEPYDATRLRVNYPNVVLANRAAHFCGGASYNKWDRVRDNPELMGRKWGGRIRRLLYAWTPDVTKAPFSPWIEIANTFTTGGWLFAGDMHLAVDGRVHLLWAEHAIDRRLRDLHFPDIKRTESLKYAVVRDGKILLRRTLCEGGEGLSGELPGAGRFQVTPEGRLIVVYYVGGTSRAGKPLSENRLMELYADGSAGEPVAVPLRFPLSTYFTATPRAGSAPSTTLDLLGTRVAHGSQPKISYARVSLW